MIRIVSWNMQGSGFGGSKWTTDVSRLFFQAEADLVCLQDCGSVPSSAVAAKKTSLDNSFTAGAFTWNLASKVKPMQVSILWVKGKMSGNLAIVGSNSFLGQGPPVFVSKEESMLALGIAFKIQQGSTLNLYTSSTYFRPGLDDPALLQQIDNTSQSTWFAVGEYGQEPSDWVWNEDIVPEGAVYCGHANVAMLPGVGTNMDYAFIGPGQAAAGPPVQAVPGKVDSTFISSDHLPIFYELPYDLSQ